MYLERIIKYANGCLQDHPLSCQKHKWAVERFLQDVERWRTDEAFPYEWDDEKAGEIVDWFKYLKHSKGVLAGSEIILSDWQVFILCQLYGWRKKENGRKRFSHMFAQVGRKNAKSQMLSGLLLFEISVEAVRNGEVYETYTAGVKLSQSKIVFKEADLMMRGSILRSKFKVRRSEITHIKSDSFIKPLSKDDGRNGDGTNGAVYVLDEYHQHPDTDFYDLALGSQTKESLMLIITTAGKDLNYPCYTQEYQYCSSVLNPDVDVTDDQYLIDICELDPEDYADPFHIDLANMLKANPIRMSYAEGISNIQKAYEKACKVPEKMTAWLTKMANVWVQAKKDGYMDMKKWKACEVPEAPFDLQSVPVTVGVDLSKKTDLTSVAWVWKKDGIYFAKQHSFIPNMEKLNEHIAVDHFPYDAAERAGLVSVTNTPIVDQSAVMDYIKQTAEQNGWAIKCIAYDPSGASKFAMDFSAEGYDLEEVFQSAKSLNESTLNFREEVYSGRIKYTPDPLLNFAMSNAVTRSTNGFIKIDKDASRFRIDPVDALLCAFKLAMYAEDETASDIINNQVDAFLEDF